MDTKTYYEVDESTGELRQTDDVVVTLHPGDRVQRKEQIEFCLEKFKREQDKTPFVWILFKYGEELFKDLNISRANLTRLIYAATFCDNEGYIMTKNQLKNQMKLNRARWNEFWNEMNEKNILHETKGMVQVNKQYFFKGKCDIDANKTRLFCEYIQALYEACDSSSSHQQLSYIFKIIPYVNRKTNIVCANPQEQDSSQIKLLKLGDFCDVVGYGRHNAKRMAKELLNIRVNGELAIGFFVTDLNPETWTIVTNPSLYFGGLRNDVFNEQKKLFQIEAQNNITQQQIKEVISKEKLNNEEVINNAGNL